MVDVAQTIGRIEGQVQAMEKRVDRFEENVREDVHQLRKDMNTAHQELRQEVSVSHAKIISKLDHIQQVQDRASGQASTAKGVRTAVVSIASAAMGAITGHYFIGK